MKPKKRQHLQIPDNLIDIDQNGYPFERTEVFQPRVGPPPGLMDEAAAQEWSLFELEALCDGLKRYAGARVFERIFRMYCRPMQVLNKYSVTEIVTIAADVREKLIQSQTEIDGQVEGWVKSIPVWTKGHHALGKENEEAGEQEANEPLFVEP